MPKGYQNVSRGIANSRVFVACLSNNYAMDDDRRMEMQYALKNLQKPVVGTSPVRCACCCDRGMHGGVVPLRNWNVTTPAQSRWEATHADQLSGWP